MSVRVGLSVYSGLGEHTIPYLDSVAGPFESLWFPDHVQSNTEGVMEGWTLLSYCLGRYPDKTCGHQVLCNGFRHPAHLAKMVASAQVMSSGRVVAGVGAGWHGAESVAYGLPFPDTETRFAQLAEAIQIMRAMWSGLPTTFNGEHYQLAGAECVPAPDPIPPIMVGGSGERYALAAVAAHADWWNHIFRDADGYRHKQRVLQDHCERVGRDYGEITQVIATNVLIAETESELRLLESRRGVRPVSANGIAGTPEQVVEQLRQAIDLGAEGLIVGFADSPSTAGTELFIESVLGWLVD